MTSRRLGLGEPPGSGSQTSRTIRNLVIASHLPLAWPNRSGDGSHARRGLPRHAESATSRMHPERRHPAQSLRLDDDLALEVVPLVGVDRDGHGRRLVGAARTLARPVGAAGGTEIITHTSSIAPRRAPRPPRTGEPARPARAPPATVGARPPR